MISYFVIEVKKIRDKDQSKIYAFTLNQTKTWILYNIPMFFRNIINWNEDLDFRWTDRDQYKKSKIKKRFAKVRAFISMALIFNLKNLDYFFNTLMKVTNSKDMPVGIWKFLDVFNIHL